MNILRKTQSICPQCLRVLDASYIVKNIDGLSWTMLQKHCPEHGDFLSPIWVDLPHTPSFQQWYKQELPQYPTLPLTSVKRGCPYDCGLCPEHGQNTCCALLEVTTRCNLHCPVCYASALEDSTDPSCASLEASLEQLLHHAGPVNIQLSGGEPTVRQDLEQIITLVRSKGFNFVQLNTNGLRLGTEESYARKLKAAGLNLVYLQWDGGDDHIYTTLRGRPCLNIKERALQHCFKAGLAVVFVATIVRGVNDASLGHIIQKALDCGPLVRGVHIQPVSSFGRYPWAGSNAPRITIPEILQSLELQTDGMLKAMDFQPPRSEHALCSFNAVYEREKNSLKLARATAPCCNSQNPAKRAQEFVATHWNSVLMQDVNPRDDFDKALKDIEHRFTISGMAFQDAYTLDLERLRRCHIHILSAEHKIIPFCAYNITSNQGISLYRKVEGV